MDYQSPLSFLARHCELNHRASNLKVLDSVTRVKSNAVFYAPRFRWRTPMDEQRKYAILFAATVKIFLKSPLRPLIFLTFFLDFIFSLTFLQEKFISYPG